MAGNLSMAGKAQLIRSSIFGVQNFWCSIFPLSKYVISEVERRIRVFLWKGTTEGPYHDKVAWTTICSPFPERGRLLVDQVRPLPQSRYFVVVGDGRLASFWFENWASFGSIWDFLDEKERSYLQVPLDANLRTSISLYMPGLRRERMFGFGDVVRMVGSRKAVCWERREPRVLEFLRPNGCGITTIYLGMLLSLGCYFMSQNHLFFACELSTQVWRMVLQKLGQYRSTGEW
ncbi:hypothetical protein LIER_19194 [Lithospermum erythrorhizon]|uniref:Uncharacterized protein n=1 Tax=Lithospermum erythrorhizon TaxID=34254 RepID=A0AAV3QKQ7_LITER